MAEKWNRNLGKWRAPRELTQVFLYPTASLRFSELWGDKLADIWVLTDGKPGHVNQSLGLAEALFRLRPDLQVTQVSVNVGWRLLTRSKPPKLIISAGRRTHLWSWICKLRFAARSIILMKPSLPIALFDMVFVPEHDQIGMSNPKVIQTRGALNRMLPGEKIHQSALILVGGPSKHVVWDDISVLHQIQRVLSHNEQIKIPVATSRRTPVAFLDKLKALEGVELILPEMEGPNWLPETLGTTKRVWVTADSVSMVFEALTAGCVVSLIGLESTPNSRTQRGIQMLVDAGSIDYTTRFDSAAEIAPLAEAERCAKILLERGIL